MIGDPYHSSNMNKSSIGSKEKIKTFISSYGKSKGYLVNFVKRQTRFYVAIKIEKLLALEIYRTIIELYELYPKYMFKTYNVDHGKEFTCYL